jgi:hypothetical protein
MHSLKSDAMWREAQGIIFPRNNVEARGALARHENGRRREAEAVKPAVGKAAALVGDLTGECEDVARLGHCCSNFSMVLVVSDSH